MDNVTIEEVRDFNVHIGLSNASRERRETVLLYYIVSLGKLFDHKNYL